MYPKEIVCLQKSRGKSGPSFKSHCHFLILSSPAGRKNNLTAFKHAGKSELLCWLFLAGWPPPYWAHAALLPVPPRATRRWPEAVALSPGSPTEWPHPRQTDDGAWRESMGWSLSWMCYFPVELFSMAVPHKRLSQCESSCALWIRGMIMASCVGSS